MAAANNRVRIVIDAKNQTAAAFGKVKAALGGVTKAVFSFKGAISAAIGVAGGAQISAMADEYKNVSARLRLATGSTDAFNSAQQALQQIATETRGSLTNTTDLFSKMRRATANLGTSQSDLLVVTKAINEAIVVSGASSVEASAALTQLGQGLASGTLRGDELNSVMEQTPRIAQLIADGMGITTGQLRQYAAQGKVTSEVVIAAIKKQAATVDQQFGQMPVTIAQSMQLVKNALFKTVGEIDQQFTLSKAVASKFTNLSAQIGPALTSIANAMIPIANMAQQVFGVVIDALSSTWDGFRQFIAIEEQAGSGFDLLTKAVKPLITEIKIIASTIGGVLQAALQNMGGDLTASEAAFGSLDSAMAIVATTIRGLREVATVVGIGFLKMADFAMAGVQKMLGGFEKVARFLHLDMADSLSASGAAIGMMRDNIQASEQASWKHLDAIVAEGNGIQQRTAQTVADTQATKKNTRAVVQNAVASDVVTQTKSGTLNVITGGSEAWKKAATAIDAESAALVKSTGKTLNSIQPIMTQTQVLKANTKAVRDRFAALKQGGQIKVDYDINALKQRVKQALRSGNIEQARAEFKDATTGKGGVLKSHSQQVFDSRGQFSPLSNAFTARNDRLRRETKSDLSRQIAKAAQKQTPKVETKFDLRVDIPKKQVVSEIASQIKAKQGDIWAALMQVGLNPSLNTVS